MNDTATPTATSRAIKARRLALAGSLLVLATLAVTSAAQPEGAHTSRPLDEPALNTSLMALELDTDAAPATIDALRARIAAVLEREGVPGVGLALVDRDGVLWAGGVGLADRDSGRPVDADTQFRVGSITKSVVALGVMRLVEQGRLDLERPLAELMPEIEIGNAWAASSPITLAHALEHTTGFDDMRFNEYYGEEGMSPREALALNPRSRVARWRPGSRMSYSNPGYTIAGHAIERATGEGWEAYLEREVLRPLGMETARFRRTPELVDRLATGYSDRDRPASFSAIAHAPAGSLLASPRELAGLVRLWLNRGEHDGAAIVGPAALARIEQTATLELPGTDTSYGLGNYGDVMHRVRSRGHDGGVNGFLSSYRYFPELGLGYVMLLNGTHSLRAYVEIRALLFAHLTRGRKLPAPPMAPPDPAAIAAAAGYYGLENPRTQLVAFIARATGGIRLSPDFGGARIELMNGASAPLVSTGDGGFRLPHEGGTSLRLAHNADGQRVIDAGMAYFESGSYAWARARLIALQAALLQIQFAPLWALGWALRAGLRRLRGERVAAGEVALQLWSAAAALLFMAMPVLLTKVFEREAFATANPWSVGLCLCTLAFAASSAVAVAEVVRASVARTVSPLARLVPSATAFACFGMTLYLLVHGIIGLRTWAW